jgi:hypothetical protein
MTMPSSAAESAGGAAAVAMVSRSRPAAMLRRTVIQITARNLRRAHVATAQHGLVAEKAERVRKCKPASKTIQLGALMYTILVLICSTTLSHADCQAKTAVDVVRGPTVDNPMMCAFNAQTMIARTDLVQADGTEYMKVVCTRAKNADQWVAELKARKAAIQ